MKSNVSVIIPTFNRCASLMDVLKTSYLDQDLVNEIIIVDDGSCDGTEDAIRALTEDSVCYIRHARNQGLPYSRNRGIEMANNKYIFFGEDDLYLPKGHIAILLKEMESHSFDIMAGRLINIIERADVFEDHIFDCTDCSKLIDPKTLTGSFNANSHGTMEVPFVHACALINKTIFSHLSYYEGFKGNAFREETDFYMRCRAQGYRIGFTDRTEAYHLRNPKTRSGGCGNNIQLTYKIRKHFNNFLFLMRNKHSIRALTGHGALWHTWYVFVTALVKNDRVHD